MRVAYLDIETDYLGAYRDRRMFDDFANHRITVIGIRTLETPADAFVQLIGSEATRPRLLAALAGVERIVTYNGRSIPDRIKRSIGFDFPVIGAQLGVVLDKEFEHVDLVPVCWKHNLYGGQKAVERLLGLERKLPGKDGAWANQRWRLYQQTRDPRYLDELLAYNKEDVYMLREIERALEKRSSLPASPAR